MKNDAPTGYDLNNFYQYHKKKAYKTDARKLLKKDIEDSIQTILQ